MSIDGAWKVEMLGAYGWERRATAFLLDGRYLASSAGHYATGHYETDGTTFRAAVRMTQFGEIRTVFGSRRKRVDTEMEGKLEGADTIVGMARPTEGENFDVRVRLTRLGSLE